MSKSRKSWFGRWMSSLSSKPEVTTAQRSGYIAAQTTGPDSMWRGSSGDANFDIQAGLTTLRQRSRDAAQNDAFARAAIDRYVDLIVGQGVKPTPMTGSVATDAALWSLWQRWGRSPVSGMSLDIYGYQRLMVRHAVTDGEAITRCRFRRPSDMPGLPPLKLQLIEADLLPVDKTERNGGNQIISGVEFDALGEITRYHMLTTHPGASNLIFGGTSRYDTEPVNADVIIHAFEPSRAGQVRGVPWLAPVLMTLRNYHGLTEAALVGARASATLAFVVEGVDSGDPMPGMSTEMEGNRPMIDADGYAVESITPGMIGYLEGDRRISRTDPKMPTGMKEMASIYQHEVAAGLGLSYHTLTGDMSDASFAQAKLGLIREKLAVDAKRDSLLVRQTMDRIWTWFVDECIRWGLIPTAGDPYAVRWSVPKIPSADEAAEVDTAIKKMQAGLAARPDLIETTGADPDEVTAAIVADNATCDEQGLTLLGDLRKVTAQGMKQMETSGTSESPDKSDRPDTDSI